MYKFIMYKKVHEYEVFVLSNTLYRGEGDHKSNTIDDSRRLHNHYRFSKKDME